MEDVVLIRAKEIALEQGKLGDSPASWEDGQLNLCAASCIAKAAIQVNDTKCSVDEFDDIVIQRDASRIIDCIFRDSGFELDARSVMTKNDSTPPAERLAWFINLVNGCAPAATDRSWSFNHRGNGRS